MRVKTRLTENSELCVSRYCRLPQKRLGVTVQQKEEEGLGKGGEEKRKSKKKELNRSVLQKFIGKIRC